MSSENRHVEWGFENKLNVHMEHVALAVIQKQLIMVSHNAFVLPLQLKVIKTCMIKEQKEAESHSLLALLFYTTIKTFIFFNIAYAI